MEPAHPAPEAQRHGACEGRRDGTARGPRRHLPGRCCAGHDRALSRESEGAGTRIVGSMNTLSELSGALADRSVRVVDLSQTLSARFPQIVLPPEFDQCAPFRVEEISRYDARGPG